jgi:chromate reductase, NAD(P)H dehydrogenase (quinone)
MEKKRDYEYTGNNPASRDVRKVLGLVGSLRNNSLNRALLDATVSFLPGPVEYETFDLDGIPHYNQDVEDSPEIPEIVRALKQKVRSADAILIATPEYNGSMTGVLKDALDWASRPHGESAFEGKPVGLLVAVGGRRGGHSVLNHLTTVIDYIDGKLVGEPVLVQLAPQKFDAQGRLTDPEVAAKIQQLLASLAQVLPYESGDAGMITEAIIRKPAGN